MLEVFAYKRYKKHKLNKQTAKEALDKKDEAFIRKSLEEHPPPSRAGGSSHSMNPLLRILHRKSVDGKGATGEEGVSTIPPTEAELAALKVRDSGTTTPTSQEEDLARVLNSLNMAVSKKTAFSLSTETRLLLKQFTQILKDIQSGAPHAYTDLTSFLERSNAHLSSLFDSTPSFLKSLISTIPFPLARKLDKKPPKDVAWDVLKELSKPGVITGVLRNVMGVLRTRFPAFVGSNALLSLGLFVLLIGVWYCYKRGKEERLKEIQSSTAPKVPEILVEGTPIQDSTDHGLETHIPSASDGPVDSHTATLGGPSTTSDGPSIPREASPLGETVVRDTVLRGDGEDTDTPLQIESDYVPSHGPGEKKIKRRGWFNKG